MYSQYCVTPLKSSLREVYENLMLLKYFWNPKNSNVNEVLVVTKKFSTDITINLMESSPLAKLWIGVLALTLAGCVGPPALHKSVLGYDETTNQLEQEILLLNIARLSHENPVHFTMTGNIAATFDFTTSGNFSGSIVTSPGNNIFSFGLSASASENPTLSIIPLSGQDFTKRVITPISENALAKLGYQDLPISIIMRLMASSIQIEDPKGGVRVGFMRNDVKHPDEYETFRRFVMHLESLQMENQLFVQHLIFNKVIWDEVKEPWAQAPPDLEQATTLEMRWDRNKDGTYKLSRRKKGRVLVSNYDHRLMTDEEHDALNEIANRQPDNYVLVDIREGYPGGEFTLFGTIKLRSFFHILKSVGNGVGGLQQDLQIDIAPDPRTRGKIEYNPRQTLTINVSDTAPSDDVLYVQYKGRYYSIGDSEWDRTAFMLLNGLFQMTVSDVSDAGIPINISK